MTNIFPFLALIPALLFAQTPWNGKANTSWYKSSDTEFTINTAEELAGLAKLVEQGTNFGNKSITIRLGADIVLGGLEWTPIGQIGKPFVSNFKFDGNGHVISGLRISTVKQYPGLFGVVESSYYDSITISNLGLVDFYVKGEYGAGGIVGGANGKKITITKSYAVGKVEGPESSLLLSRCLSGICEVSSCYFDTTITSAMKNKATYKGWDFTNMWGIGYPTDNPLNGGLPYSQQLTPLGQAQIGGIGNVIYTGSKFTPTPSVTLNGTEMKAGVDFDYIYGENTNPGTGTVTIVGKTASFWGERNFTFNIGKIQLPRPSLTQTTFAYDGTAKTVSTNIAPAANHFSIGGVTSGTSVGSYTATATFLANTNYYEWQGGGNATISLPWKINKGPGTDCKVTMSDFTASGTASKPVPSSPNGTYSISSVKYLYKNQTNSSEPETENLPANAGAYKVTATFPATANYEQCIATANFIITEGDCTPKKIQVSWTTESVFTYNKMVQAPVPSVSEPGIELLRSNAHSAAGIYKDQDAAYAIIKDDAQRCNYALANNTKDYEIKKKNLKPYFDAPTALSNIESNADTVWVPHAIFSDPALLRQILDNLLNYDGFAQDTITKEKDDASVLRNTPAINVIYATQPAAKILAKRVETTQTAVAVVNTDGVSADNYALAKRSITIMEIQDEDTGTKRVLCFRGNYCTELSEDVCAFIKGEKVSNCNNIKRSCRIDTDLCIDNMFISECNSIGGTVITMSCEEYVPIKRPTLAANAFRVWQTASGTVNIDLGYMPTSPATIQIYNLQGKLLATEQATTRFATIKLNAAGGVYLFKAGTRTTVKAIK